MLSGLIHFSAALISATCYLGSDRSYYSNSFVDAAYCSENKIASLGMVVRNDIGAIRLCAVMKTCNVESPLQADAKAVAFGLEIAKGNSFPFILVESDSLLVIQEILKYQESREYYLGYY